MIHFDEHIFQMGRNLQPAIIHPSRKADAMIPDLKLRKETAPQVPTAVKMVAAWVGKERDSYQPLFWAYILEC